MQRLDFAFVFIDLIFFSFAKRVKVSAAEWRNRFVKVNKHMDKVKELVLKLCKETKQWRDKKEPKKKEQVSIWNSSTLLPSKYH